MPLKWKEGKGEHWRELPCDYEVNISSEVSVVDSRNTFFITRRKEKNAIYSIDLNSDRCSFVFISLIYWQKVLEMFFNLYYKQARRYFRRRWKKKLTDGYEGVATETTKARTQPRESRNLSSWSSALMCLREYRGASTAAELLIQSFAVR